MRSKRMRRSIIRRVLQFIPVLLGITFLAFLLIYLSPSDPVSVRMSAGGISVSPEINLLGKTVDEAIAELDKYLDDAYLAHLTPVRIVHGKGTGALRQGIHNYLKRLKYVKSYRLGAFGEGDAGVTIVEFK